MRIFCDWHHKWSSFWAILAHVTWPRAQALGQSISLKFSLETRLESESLIDFPTFLVQKLWYKKNKFIYCLINQIFLLIYIITFQPDTPDTPSSEVLKSSDCTLVSNKNFSEILPSNGLGPRPGEVRQGGLKGLQCWRHSQNIRTPNQKMFFSSAEQKTCHVFWAFEQLCTAFGTRVILAQIHKSTCDPVALARKSSNSTRRQIVMSLTPVLEGKTAWHRRCQEGFDVTFCNIMNLAQL